MQQEERVQGLAVTCIGCVHVTLLKIEVEGRCKLCEGSEGNSQKADVFRLISL